MNYYGTVSRWKSLCTPVNSYVFNMGHFVLVSSSDLLVACNTEGSSFTPTDVLQFSCTLSPIAPCYICRNHKEETQMDWVSDHL